MILYMKVRRRKTNLHEVVAFSSNGFVLSDCRVSKHRIVTDIRSITITLNVHSPFTIHIYITDIPISPQFINAEKPI